MSLYGNLKVFHHPEHLSSLKSKEILAPLHVRVKPVNACNHNCWFCAYRADFVTLGDQMELKHRIPFEKMMELVDDFIEMKVKAVTFSGGGEPLMYKSLDKVIKKLGAANIRIGSLTNGAFLKNAIAEAFAESGTWVRISTDGWDDKSLTKSRGVKEGEYTSITDNMRNFIKMGSQCILGISFIVTAENYAHIYDFCKQMKKIGINHVKITGCIVSNSGAENNEYHKKMVKRVTLEIKKSLKLATEDFTIMNHYHRMEENFNKSYSQCHFLRFLTVIGADCKVYTCQDKAYTENGILGSIEKTRFKDFWNSSLLKEKILTFNPLKQCNHHCITNEKNLALDSYLKLQQGHIDFV